MHSFEEEIKNTIKNTEGVTSSFIGWKNMRIWTGPLYNYEMGKVRISKGYNQTTHTCYATDKKLYQMFVSGQWTPQPMELELARKAIFTSPEAREALNKRVTDARQARVKAGEKIGQNNDENKVKTEEGLVNLIAYSMSHVYNISVSLEFLKGKNIDILMSGGVVDPSLFEIAVQTDPEGKINPRNAQIVPNDMLPREFLSQVPWSAGVALADTVGSEPQLGMADSSASSDPIFHKSSITKRFRALRNRRTSANDNCTINSGFVVKPGDAWYGGIRTTLNGYMEVWVDDMRKGALIKDSRGSFNSSSRIHRYNIDPFSQLKYGTKQFNYLGGTQMGSNAINDAPVFIEDFFGDPGLWIGIVQALVQLMAATEDDNFDYTTDLIDLGSIDLEKFFRPLEGAEV